MKKISFLFLLIAVLSVYGPNCFAVDPAAESKVTAYYFHWTFRCYTCTNMEKYSREAIETNFKDALGSGKLEFKSINVEDKGNEHFMNDYQLYTKSLVLSLVKDGREVRSKNLDKIWELAGNKQKFIDYVREETGRFLEEGQ